MSVTATATTALRLELKQWEKAFAGANGGRKPRRDDIKRDASIAAKYKEYDRLRAHAAQEQTTPTKIARTKPPPQCTPLKQRSANTLCRADPSVDEAASTTPHSKKPAREEVKENKEDPTPACVRLALGPTPQKDGDVLGIFDLLPGATPSKGGTSVSARVAQGSSSPHATPTKPAAAAPPSTSDSSRTPQSSGKRFYLDAFAGTPLKRKCPDTAFTPSTSKRQYATPSFLRRDLPMAILDGDGDGADVGGAAPPPPPFRKRGLARSLSTIIQDLRKQEDERMDEEMDIMREMEEEGEEHARLSRPRPGPATATVLVEDSQTVEMPLGPDQGARSSDGESDRDPGALDANGNPRKVWKKKGLKRQTKRVIMRPVLHKPAKAREANGASEVGRVGRWRGLDNDPGNIDDNESIPGSDEDYNGDGHDKYDDNEEQRKAKLSKRSKKHESTETDGAGREKTSTKTKKPNTLAHTNFRKLKIKNKNSKASGRGGRFGRR